MQKSRLNTNNCLNVIKFFGKTSTRMESLLYLDRVKDYFAFKSLFSLFMNGCYALAFNQNENLLLTYGMTEISWSVLSLTSNGFTLYLQL